MIVKVKLNELREVANKMQEDSKLLSDEIAVWQNSINELGSYWMGVDYNSFYNNSMTYLDKMKDISTTLNNFNVFINKSCNLYSQQDVEFGEAIGKVAVKNE